MTVCPSVSYDLDWLWSVRQADPGDSKKSRIDYGVLERVLLVRPDLISPYLERAVASKAMAPLDALVLGIAGSFDHEAVQHAPQLRELASACAFRVPSWLPEQRARCLRRALPDLECFPAPDAQFLSFEEVRGGAAARVAYVRRLIASSSGQVDLSMFLRKALGRKDVGVFQYGLDFAEAALLVHGEDRSLPQLPDLIVGCLAGCPDIFHCARIAEMVLRMCTEVKALADDVAPILGERVQAEHLVDADPSAGYALKDGLGFVVKLSDNLPVMFSLLSGCLRLSKGAGWLGEIDALLFCPVVFKAGSQLRDWLVACLNVFSQADPTTAGGMAMLEGCVRRLAQLMDAEQEASSTRPCTEVSASSMAYEAVLRLMVKEAGSSEPIAMQWAPATAGSACALQPQTLGLLDVGVEPSVSDSKEKGTATTLSRPQVEYLLDRAEQWVGDSKRIDGRFVRMLSGMPLYSPRAISLALLYEKQFHELPVEASLLESGDSDLAKLLSLVSSSSAELKGFLSDGFTPRKWQKYSEILCKCLVRHPDALETWIGSMGDVEWMYRTAWSAVNAVDCKTATLDSIAMAVRNVSLLVKIGASSESCTGLLVKQSKTFYSTFENDLLSLLSALFVKNSEGVISILKELRVGTRYVHALCASQKAASRAIETVSAHIPPLKKTLESIVFKVKLLLKENNCLAAFEMRELTEPRHIRGSRPAASE